MIGTARILSLLQNFNKLNIFTNCITVDGIDYREWSLGSVEWSSHVLDAVAILQPLLVGEGTLFGAPWGQWLSDIE